MIIIFYGSVNSHTCWAFLWDTIHSADEFPQHELPPYRLAISGYVDHTQTRPSQQHNYTCQFIVPQMLYAHI